MASRMPAAERTGQKLDELLTLGVADGDGHTEHAHEAEAAYGPPGSVIRSSLRRCARYFVAAIYAVTSISILDPIGARPVTPTVVVAGGSTGRKCIRTRSMIGNSFKSTM